MTPITAGIERDNNIAHRLVIEIDGLKKEDLLPFMTLLLLCRDDVSDDSSDDHLPFVTYCLSIASTIATTVASVGTSSGLKANDASRPRQT